MRTYFNFLPYLKRMRDEKFPMIGDTSHHLEKIHPSAFIAPDVIVIGNVAIKENASVWFGTVVRGDSDLITIGSNTNVQDGCILHADRGQPCVLGTRVTLGHGAIVHAAVVEDEVLVGIRATVLDRARIGTGSIIAAGSVVSPGTVIPPRSLVMGILGKVVRSTTDEELTRIRKTAERYVENSRVYREAYKCSKKEKKWQE